MISPQSITNPTCRSGYSHVTFVDGPSRDHTTSYYQARSFAGAAKRGGQSGNATAWVGSRCATALEAAWDYCNYANGNGVQPVQKLKSAGHPSKPRTKAAAQAAKRARAKALKDLKGFVYLVGEEGDDRYVKIGESKDHPRYRLRDLQTGNPRKLTLLGFLQCSDRLSTERQLHMKHIRQNHLQEWFKKDPKILQEFPQTQKTGI